MVGQIDETAKVSNIKLGENSYIFRGCRVNDTKIGKHSFIGDNSVVKFSKLGNYTQIARNSMVQYSEFGDYSYGGACLTAIKCKIGKFCAISWNVSVGGGNHDYKKMTSHSFLYEPWFDIVDNPLYDRLAEDCIIGNDVWIGAGVNVLRGVTINNGAVIGAGTVVTKDVPAYAVVCGNPGRIIKYRFSDEIIAELEDLCWWYFNPEFIRKYADLFNKEPTLDILAKIRELKAQDSFL